MLNILEELSNKKCKGEQRLVVIVITTLDMKMLLVTYRLFL